MWLPTFFCFVFCPGQFSSNSCNCCLIIWHIHIRHAFSYSLLRTLWIEWEEFIYYNKEQSAPLSFSDISLFMMLSMALRLSEDSAKQCIALRYIESSTIRSCVVDNFERGRGRQTPDKSDCQDYLSVSDVRSALWATMALRITVAEIRPCWGKRKEKRKRGRKERRERGKESEEWRIGMWLD